MMATQTETAEVARARLNLEVQNSCLHYLKRLLDEEGATPGLSKAYERQYQAVCKAQENYDRLRQAVSDDVDWAKRERELTEELRKEYQERGPQYDLLIGRLVSSELAVERIERSGRGQDTTDWRSANRAVIQAVQALQKYTESQKQEVLQTARQEGMLVILELGEKFFAPKAPDMWARFIEEVDRNRLTEGVIDGPEARG